MLFKRFTFTGPLAQVSCYPDRYNRCVRCLPSPHTLSGFGQVLAVPSANTDHSILPERSILGPETDLGSVGGGIVDITMTLMPSYT